jgi:hypothetical protein
MREMLFTSEGDKHGGGANIGYVPTYFTYKLSTSVILLPKEMK